MTATAQRNQQRTFLALTRRLQSAGLEREFVRAALVPSWWTKEHERIASLLPTVEIAVARFLNTPVSVVRDPSRQLELPRVKAKLRKPKAHAENEFASSVYAALAVAQAVVRNIKGELPTAALLPDPLQFRQELLRDGREAIGLRALVEALWTRGVPVVHLVDMPTGRKFRGMACCVEERPVVLLGWGGKHAPRFLWDLAHEAGHIAHSHISSESPMLDASDDTVFSDEEQDEDETQHEREANAYAARLLGTHGLSVGVDAGGANFGAYADLTRFARRVRERAKALRVDAGLIAHCWSVETGNYSQANHVMRVLDKMNGPSILREAMLRHVDFLGAPETDANLLRCVVKLNDDP